MVESMNVESMNIGPMMMLTEREPQKLNHTGTKILALQKRLRSISRTRRETLVKRSEQLDRILSELVAEVSTSQTPLESMPKLEHGHLQHDPYIVSNEYSDHTQASSTIRKPYSDDVCVLHAQIDFLNQEFETAMLMVEQTRRDELDTKEQLEVLRSQLLEARHDTVELRIQAAESCRTDARFDNRQVRPTSAIDLPQGTSWEEQKLALLRAFELESESINLSTMTTSEIESLFAATKREIADRDMQIEELKSMLDMQSRVTADGFAMGASAVSQILDMDPFIQEERDRLMQLQDELQQKLRDAEIEISVERARITRDRLSLQNASQTFAEESLAASANNAATLEAQQLNSGASIERKLVPGSIPRTRRWLQRLGLRDDE